MPVDWDADVLVPLEEIFGEPATYQPAAGGAPYPIVGVFDRAHQEAPLLDQDSPVNVLHAVLGVRLAQFAAQPVPNDRVTIPSVGLTYIVKDAQVDGHGWAKLVLMQPGGAP